MSISFYLVNLLVNVKSLNNPPFKSAHTVIVGRFHFGTDHPDEVNVLLAKDVPISRLARMLKIRLHRQVIWSSGI